jgi:hypothetical protein
MADFTTRTVMEGYVKDIYDKLVDPIPREAGIIQDVRFKGGAQQLGNRLLLAVQISDEGGFTHSASEDAVTLEDAISMESKQAIVDGYTTALSGKVSYLMAERASSSRKSFMEVTGHKMQNMVSSAKKRLACEMLHGQRGIGVGSTSTTATVYCTVVMTEASWAPFIWQGKKGQLVEAYLGDNTARVTSVTGPFKIVSVNTATRTVKLEETVAGDAADLNTYIGANPDTANFHWYTTIAPGPVWATMAGMIKISLNTTATLFNIDAAANDVWQGNEYACGGAPLTLAKILDGAGRLADRGATAKLTLRVSNKTWQNIFTDQAALRRYGAELRDLKLGGRSIEIAYQGTSISVVGDGFIKRGEALLYEPPKWSRVGAKDLSFKVAGAPKNEEIFIHDPSKLGFAYRYWGHQAVFCEMPSHQMVFTGIVNT